MIRKLFRESLYDVEEADINNNPLAGEPHEITDPGDHDFDKVVELDTDLKIGIKEKPTQMFVYFIHSDVYGSDTNEKVIGSADLKLRDPAPYPVMGMIRIHPDYQGKGYGKTFYEWMINNYGGLISDSTLTKRAGKGSYHIWQSLENDGYEMSVIRWSDLEDQKWWNPKPVKSIKNWVRAGRGGFRLVAEQ